MRLKVLWLCSRPLIDFDDGQTGTWQGALARGLMDSSGVELGIIATGPVSQFTRRDFRHVTQWLVPERARLGRDGLPRASLVEAIVKAAKEFSPDLINIWGTESFWGLLVSRGVLTYKSLLEIQGLKGPIAKVFFGDLTLAEQLRSIGIKELLKRRTINSDAHDFALWGLREEEIIRGHRLIVVQSDWTLAQVKRINPNASVFHNDRALRQAFYDADGWQSTGQNSIFCAAAYAAPFKGLHVAIRALSLLKRRIPDVRLRIAGAHRLEGIRADGYMRWISRIIRQLCLSDAIEWLGQLNAEQIVTELKSSAAVVVPSFMESYSLACAEAMIIGTPLVASYVGGIPSIGKDDDSCLFFSPGDEVMCAHQLELVLTDAELALRLSLRSRKCASMRNDLQRITRQQLTIYGQIAQSGDEDYTALPRLGNP